MVVCSLYNLLSLQINFYPVKVLEIKCLSWAIVYDKGPFSQSNFCWFLDFYLISQSKSRHINKNRAWLVKVTSTPPSTHHPCTHASPPCTNPCTAQLACHAKPQSPHPSWIIWTGTTLYCCFQILYKTVISSRETRTVKTQVPDRKSWSLSTLSTEDRHRRASGPVHPWFRYIYTRE